MFLRGDVPAVLRIEEIDLLGEGVVVTGGDDLRGFRDGIDAMEAEGDARRGGRNLAPENAGRFTRHGEDLDAVKRWRRERVLAFGNGDPGEKTAVFLALDGFEGGSVEGIDDLSADGGNGNGIVFLVRRIRIGKREGGEETGNAGGSEDKETGADGTDRFHGGL
jgi:hypothetical protein